MKQKRSARTAIFCCAALLSVVVAVSVAAPDSFAQGKLSLTVVGATAGESVTSYKYIINLDNTGVTTQRTPLDGCSPSSPGYPASCKWTSIAGVPGSSPIITQGTQADFAGAGSIDLPAGRYLISVLADGYKLDGEHFTVGTSNLAVTVKLQPFPLPDATIQAAVFEDISPVNGAPDLPAEHGLAGFQGHISDYLGEVTTDVYGAPLCGTGRCLSACYVVNNGVDIGTVSPIDAAGRCPVDTTGLANTLEGTPIPAGAAVEGKLKIPNVGPNRYALSITPPDGSRWIQTTTLEGNHDWDAWVMEGATGLDTEFVIAGEPFPAIIFGYVPGPSLNKLAGGTGIIKGVIEGVKVYVPTKGGIGLPGSIWGGASGMKLDQPIANPWVTLSDLSNGDTVVWIGQGDANGAFTIPNVPAGTYTLTWWDEKQNYILDLLNVTVGQGETVDMGLLPLTGWWTRFEGYVFNDTNRNGVKDPGEAGLANYTLTMRKRENSLMDRGATLVTTDADGHYVMENAYPMTQWLVMEAYDDLHYTTGVTFQADNQLNPTTHLGAGVDVSVHPVIGLGGRLDWGKHVYDPTGTNGIDPRNGGIVGTVSYDTTRNELNPQYAVAEDWQPGISGLTMKLYAPVPCTAAPCDASGRYALVADGSIAKGPLLNTYVTEAWQRPKTCVARNVDNNPLVHGVDEQVLPLDPDADCLEGPLMGVQFGTYATDQGSPAANFGANVDGNFGFGEGCFDGTLDATDPSNPVCVGGSFTTLPGGRDYLVEVVIPDDIRGIPTYKVTREEDINIGNGDDFVPAVPPPSCAGPLHTVDSTGNPTFPGGPGTSPYEGMQKPLCTTKLVTLANGKSVVPVFHLFTDVPIPTRFWGLIVDDLNFSADPKSLDYGEKAGVPFAPVGIYDYTDRLITTVESDYNGLFDVLLPSSNRINCPTPSGVCANLYRFVGNDPGTPGRLNPNYNPQFRTIAAEFEAIPGLLVPADLAPTQVGVTVQLPGGQTTQPVNCALDGATPQIFAVNRPYGFAGDTITIKGQGFGATRGSGTVKFDGVAVPGNWNITWSNTQITVTPQNYGQIDAGPHQLSVTANNGQTTVNGLTYHYLRSTGANAYNPTILEVGPGVANPRYRPSETLPGAANHAIQNALDDAPVGALVVVYPNNPSANPRQNPRGAYYENLIISKRVKLQGVGPGSPDGAVRGSIIDGGAFAGDSPVATDWYTRIGSLTWSGNQTIYDGAVISLFLPSSGSGAFPTTYTAITAPSIDGFDLRGGDQQGFPGNINAIGGGPTGLPAGLITQGGAIFANGYARNLQITNNVIQNNGGAYGTIRIGTPDLPAPDTNNHNEGVVIAYNRVIANAGTNLAGGIGIFNGADSYQIVGNDVCGNFSAEYGGGISAVGYSPNGTIRNNRVYFNRSYDEGGGIMIAGALPTNPAALSPGSGPVNIYSNLVQANLANDDGGGIRFLMAGNFPMNVYNNFIVNNVSTHEGGGVSLNDAPNVRVYNNTIMKNLTTATAVTSNGSAAPAGLSTSLNSDQLQATLPGGSPLFSNPLLFNNIFWDNRAGTRAGGIVTGLGTTGDASPIHNWDMGVADLNSAPLLSPTNSVIQTGEGVIASPTNQVGVNPNVKATYDTSVAFNAWRNNPAFVGAILVAVDLPPNLMGDYHINNSSPAYNSGAASKSGVGAPSFDIDGQGRPAWGGYDIGADEIPAPTANLGIAITDGVTTINAGGSITYTIVVTNAGPDAITGATVTDNLPVALTGAAWTCSGCTTTSGSGNINTTVNLAVGGSATLTLNATVSATATGSVSNTATVAPPAGAIDPVPGNNSATDTDTIAIPLPTLAVLDNFNRADATTLGSNWSQVIAAGVAAIRIVDTTPGNTSTGLANATLPGNAYWNVPTSGFGAKQGAAFTIANTTLNGDSLILKASGTVTLGVAQNFIRVRTTGTQVIVETTVNTGGSFTSQGTFAATFANGNTLTAVANADGSVDVWRTAGATTTYIGRSTAASAFAGTGRIGVQLPTGARIDNFSGGTLP